MKCWTRGPTITRYEVYPARGVRVNTFDQYAKDIALATKAESVNIVAPIPGKDTVGIEIVNRNKVAVPLRELLQDPGFCSPKKKPGIHAAPAGGRGHRVRQIRVHQQHYLLHAPEIPAG